MKNADELWSIADPGVLQDMRDFHARQRLVSRTEVFSTLVSPGYDPGYHATCEFEEYAYAPLPLAMRPLAPAGPPPAVLRRRGSVRRYAAEGVTFDTLSTLLRWAKCATNERGHRPYPSGGGLYPIETFVAPLRTNAIEGLDDAVHRVLAKSGQLEMVADIDPAQLRDAVTQREPLTLPSPPAFMLAYAASFERVVPKYRHRGYRTALVEVGAIVQQVDLCAQALGLATVPWAWFDEYELSRLLGLNPVRLPLVLLQLVGRPSAVGG